MIIAERETIYMKDITKKVVILNNFSSPYISEAIIVLRDYNPKLEGKIIDEAEKVVEEYLTKYNSVKKERSYKPTAQKLSRKNKPHITFAVLLILAAAAIAGIFLHFTS